MPQPPSANSPPFTRADFERDRSRLILLNKGGFANGDVYRYPRPDGSWVVKDFSPCLWIFRILLTRWMIRRECRALQRVNGLTGIPADAFQLDADAFADRDLGGRSMHEAPKGSLGAPFFRELERRVHRLHRRGIAHLDLRYRRNILVLDDGRPGIIDFQSAIALPRLPRGLQRFLRRVDLSGVYKHWCRRAPDSLGPRRLALLQGGNRLRSWWILKGYRLIGFKKKTWRTYEQKALTRKPTS